jgi:alpha-amylase
MRVLALVLMTSACGGSVLPDAVTTQPPPVVRPTLSPTYRASGHAAAGDVAVHLFDWPWNDIATECERVIGPAGFAAVQVSPPQEHSITPSHDWSERYQPVSYSIAKSRSGTGAEFASMVARCKVAGVGIYVDAVINHMTNSPSPGIGSNGTAYSKYEYPGLYTMSDFHTPCPMNDFSNPNVVWDCELLGLPDLNTGSASVRQKIAGYLLSLTDLGVVGFRVDAAKHIQPVELDKIFTIVDSTLAAEGKPPSYFYLEVASNSSDAVPPQAYYGEAYSSGGSSDITEFTYRGVGNKFTGLNGEHISQLDPNGPPGAQFSAGAWGMLPSDKAVVFLQNHDTQHTDGGVGYRDGQTFRLANVWMLAMPYGYPSVLSSFAFSYPSQNSMGPPSDAAGWTLPVTCASSLETAQVGQWVCEHRDPYIRNMVAFRRATAGTDVNHFWSDNAQAIAFSRGGKGFIAINNGAAPLNLAVSTGMPAGVFCDRIAGGRAANGCVGASVTVDAAGAVTLALAAKTAVAIDVGTRAQ